MNSTSTSPAPAPPPPTRLDALLADVQEEHRDFFVDIFRSLPPGYVLTPGGIALRGPGSPLPFCSPFRVAALTRRGDGTGWSNIVEILDPDGSLVSCTLSWKMRDGRSADAMAHLAEHGLRLHKGVHRDAVLDLIRSWPDSRARLLEIERPGWTDNRQAFALPCGEVLTRKDAPQGFHYKGVQEARIFGDRATWRQGVAALCVGNPSLVFACSAAFAAPLLAFSPSSSSVVFHFYGPSSVGKTRILRAGQTIWPKAGQGDKSWRVTINGLEAEAAAANDLLLGLDDLPDDPPDGFGQAIYMLGNAGGKARATRDGTRAPRQTWRTIVLSTGEIPSAIALKKHGQTPRGGQGVRMIDIPVVGQFGAFDALHGYPSGGAFVTALDKQIAAAAGPAGRAFVRSLLTGKPEEVASAVERQVEEQVTLLLDALGVEGDSPANEVHRVVTSFARVAVAGELATKLQITGWPSGTAAAAVVEIARRWLDGRGSVMPRDQAEAVENTRAYLLRHGERFQMIPVQDESATLPDLFGYRDKEFFYILPQAFAEIHAGRTPDTIAAFLQDAGYLSRGGEKGSLQIKMSGLGKNQPRPRAYRIRNSILDA